MKDKQIALASPEPSIFLVSAALHCVSMPALVFLRSSFGFGYLRPKSVFFAFSWAFVLYAIYAWIESTVWGEHLAFLLFGAGAVILYWTHLSTALVREWKECGEHEQFSGMPHPVWLILQTGNVPSVQFEKNWRLWGEPAAVLVAGAALRLNSGEHGFATCVFTLALCLWGKETLNRWFQLRQRKRQKDIFADTEDAIEPRSTTDRDSEPPVATRRAKVKRSRSADATAVESGEE